MCPTSQSGELAWKLTVTLPSTASAASAYRSLIQRATAGADPGSCEYSHVEAGHEVYQCACSSQYTGESCAEESWFLTVLLVALAGAIVLGISICSWWFHVKRLRERTYTTFLSHAKSDGGETAAHLHTAFDKALLWPCTRRGPNFIDTEMLRGSLAGDPTMAEDLIGMTPLARLGRPKDIADTIAVLAGPDANWITRQNLPVDGGIVSR